MMFPLPAYTHGDDIFMVAHTFSQVHELLQGEAFNPDTFEVFWWQGEKQIDFYLIWNIAYVQRIAPNTPLFFNSTYPISRFIYVVKGKEDLLTFDPNLPWFVNNITLFAHISGIQPYAFYIKLVYKVASINYGYFDWLWSWLF